MGYYENLIGRDNMLKLANFVVGSLFSTALADGIIQKEELQSMESIISSNEFVNPLLNEVMDFYRKNTSEVQSYSQKLVDSLIKKDYAFLKKYNSEINELIYSLPSTIGEEKYKEFAAEVVALNLLIARAAGGRKGFLGIGSKDPVTNEEKLLLNNYIYFLGITPSDVEKFLERFL